MASSTSSSRSALLSSTIDLSVVAVPFRRALSAKVTGQSRPPITAAHSLEKDRPQVASAADWLLPPGSRNALNQPERGPPNGPPTWTAHHNPEDAHVASAADAALFCAVHDILQSPDALRNVLSKLRPGARVAAGGGKWAAPWTVAVNLPVTMLHAPYVRSFKGFQRPWHHLGQLLEDVHVQEVGLGSGYILTGQAPPRTVSDSRPLAQ